MTSPLDPGSRPPASGSSWREWMRTLRPTADEPDDEWEPPVTTDRPPPAQFPSDDDAWDPDPPLHRAAGDPPEDGGVESFDDDVAQPDLLAAGPAADDQFGIRLRWPAATDQGEPVAATTPAPEGEDGPALLPAMAGRIEGVHGAIATLALRVEGLSATVNTLRSVLSDRIADYADTAVGLSRSQAAELAEYRHGSDRLVGELRRSISETEETLRRLNVRIDDLTTGVASLVDLTKTVATESREIVSGGEKVGRQVSEGLDRFGDRMLEQTEELREELGTVLSTVRTDLATIHKDLADVRRLRSDLAAFATSRADLVAELADAVPDPSVATAALQDDLTDLLTAMSGETDLPAIATAIAELREEVAAAGPGSGRSRRPNLTKGELDTIADAIAERLARTFEVVVDDAAEEPEPPEEPAPPSERRGRRPGRRSS